MTKVNILSILFFCMLFSCKSQDIRIILEDGVIVKDEDISVFFITNGKDTINLKPNRHEYYCLEKTNENTTLIVKYKTSLFELTDLRDITKCIYIDYKPEAEGNCFVIHEMYSDAMQTIGINKLRNCSDITNIYFYREFEPKITKMGVSIRKGDK
jgi:hypothetical protein